MAEIKFKIDKMIEKKIKEMSEHPFLSDMFKESFSWKNPKMREVEVQKGQSMGVTVIEEPKNEPEFRIGQLVQWKPEFYYDPHVVHQISEVKVSDDGQEMVQLSAAHVPGWILAKKFVLYEKPQNVRRNITRGDLRELKILYPECDNFMLCDETLYRQLGFTGERDDFEGWPITYSISKPEEDVLICEGNIANHWWSMPKPKEKTMKNEKTGWEEGCKLIDKKTGDVYEVVMAFNELHLKDQGTGYLYGHELTKNWCLEPFGGTKEHSKRQTNFANGLNPPPRSVARR
jgi:hypothetical protein